MGALTKGNHSRNYMAENRDYTKRAFGLTVMVIAILIGLSFIPPFTIGGVTIKRANILSDIIDFGDAPAISETSESLLDTSFLELFRGTSRNEADTTASAGVVSPAGSPPSAEAVPDSVRFAHLAKPTVSQAEIVNIEDFSPGQTMMSRFYHSLAYQSERRPIRIAVLGDSFIEADIITADLREQLQMRYGGSGVGFVPFSTPLSKYRGTVRHTHQGWTNYNVVKIKDVPEEYRPWFFVSGNISIPNEGAATEYRGVPFRNRIEKTNSASLLFVNRGGSVLDVTVNDSLSYNFRPASSQDVDCIPIRHRDIFQIEVKVGNPEGFIGYGVVLEDSVGVSVHNFSVRSNSGMALFGTDYGINSQINALMNYDLIILQYGLNAMSADVTNYSYYGLQLCRIIEYIKQCFPGSAILVMSVGDRSTLKGGTATTMPAVEAMVYAQREAARTSGVGFWNTFEAMGGKNSMPEFVKRQWASKDHTHIGYQGGKYIAGQLVAYLNAAVESIREQDGPLFEPILDIVPTQHEAGMPVHISTGHDALPVFEAARGSELPAAAGGESYEVIIMDYETLDEIPEEDPLREAAPDEITPLSETGVSAEADDTAPTGDGQTAPGSPESGSSMKSGDATDNPNGTANL